MAERHSGRHAAGWREVGILAGLALLTLLLTYPLGFQIASRVVQPAEDPQLNSWIMAWDAHALLTEPAQLFATNAFYPYPDALAYSEHLLGSALPALPLQMALGQPIAVYGLMGLLALLLSAYGGYLLGRHLTGNRWAGLLAGVIFAFCPYKLSQINHFQNLSAQWLPFILLYLSRLVETGRKRDVVLLAFFLGLQALSCVYYALFLAAGVPLVALPLLLLRYGSDGRWLGRRLLALGAAGALAVAAVLPAFLPYARLMQSMDAGRSLSYVIQLSPDLLSYLATPAGNLLYGEWSAPLRKAPEGSLFPGLLALGLAGWGAWHGLRERRTRPAAAALLTLTLGAGLLSLGPTIQIAGHALVRGPYILLWRYVPGFSGVRVPGRLAVWVMLGLAGLAALGLASLWRGTGARRRVLSGALLALICLEYANIPLPTAPTALAGPTPAVYDWLAQQPAQTAVLELPIDLYPAFENNVYYMLQSTRHWKRLVNGYSGVFPAPHLALVDLAGNFPAPDSLALLRQIGVDVVIVHSGRLAPAEREVLTQALAKPPAGVRKLGDFGEASAYALEPAEEPLNLALGGPAARPFLLKGWSHRDDRMGGQAGVWLEEAEGRLWLPGTGAEQVLRLTAWAPVGQPPCEVAWDGVLLGALENIDGSAAETPLALPAGEMAGFHQVSLRCPAQTARAANWAIGETGEAAPANLSVAVGEYVDLYVDGKRYSVDTACMDCLGLLLWPAGADAPVWRAVEPKGFEALAQELADQPTGTVVVIGARAGTAWPPALDQAVAGYGAGGFPAADRPYVLIGVQDAPADSALESAEAGNAWLYVGEPRPTRRLFLTHVELAAR